MERETRNRYWVVAGWLGLALAMVAAFAHTFADMWMRWFPAWNTEASLYGRIVEGESYYTHGPLVGVVSLLIVVLLVRHTRIEVKPARFWGALVLSAGLGLHLLAALARVTFVSGFALIIILAGLVLLLWGKMALRRLWFPLAFLVFMVPLPEVTIADLNFRLKMYSAALGVNAASAIGVIVERVGNRVILTEDKSLVVANVCNGLRTLVSLLAFGALYAYVSRLRGAWRLVLLAATIPIAVIANSTRIVSLIVVADIWNPQVATGKFHDASGILIFVMAFGLMFGLERAILWIRRVLGMPATIVPLFDGQVRPADQASPWPAMRRAGQTPRMVVAVAALTIAAGGAMWLHEPLRAAQHGSVAGGALPASMAVAGQDWVGYDQVLDQRTQTILETSDYLNRTYVRAGEAPVDFCIVFSQDNRKGTHPPDLCLEGGGNDIVFKNDLKIASLPCRELIVQGQGASLYFLYTYKCGQSYTSSFWQQQFVIFRNGLLHRNSSGALIRVSMAIDPLTNPQQARLAARQRCSEFMAAAAPHLRQLP